MLEQDIANHQGKVLELRDTARKFQDEQHFMAADCQQRAKSIYERYKTMNEPCQIRRDNLEDAQLLYQFSRDVEDELSWIKEKLPLASSKDLGNSLTAVQNLQKKHQVSSSLVDRSTWSNEQFVRADVKL